MSSGASERLRVVVLGYVVRGPFGGMVWHHLQYAVGLRRLGHDVLFLEDSDDYASCYDPARGVMDTDPSYGLAFAAAVFGRVGLGDRWAYHDAHRRRWFGPRAGDAAAFRRSADLVLNVSGANPLRDGLLDAPARALVDTDPAFTQIRHLTEPAAAARARQHTAFFSFGENLASGCAEVPDDGLPWRATRQPVVADLWPVTPPPPGGRLTTVMHWESYPAREYGGVRYGRKAESFAPYEGLPARLGPRFELVLGGATAPRERLRAAGWLVRDPESVAADPWSYRRYLRRSLGEFAVAKHGYVAGRTGWFSERSAGYLASGRPVVVQDTGFGSWLETGAGVLAFRDPDGAAAGVEEVLRRGDFHARAARDLALNYFDSRAVLTRLVEGALNPVEPAGAPRGGRAVPTANPTTG